MLWESIVLALAPVFLDSLVGDVLKYDRLLTEGLAFNVTHDTILRRNEVLSFLTSLATSSFIMGIQQITLSYTLLAIAWLLVSFSLCFSIAPLVKADQVTAPKLFKLQEFLIEKKMLLRFMFVAVVVLHQLMQEGVIP